MLMSSGADGLGSCCHSSRTVANERVSELSFFEKSGDDRCVTYRLGESVRGQDSERQIVLLQKGYINFLELLTVFLELKIFLQFLRNHNVLIRSDNTTAVEYINHQGVHAPLSFTVWLIVWGMKHFQ